jgi:glycosyltransferase involved in cell wall biosynthesis
VVERVATQNRPRVCVLLSTYNGERFLGEQLDSILAQQDVEVLLLVRDDGSSDGTLQILERYASAHPSIQVHKGANLGVVRSFLELMRLAPAEPGWLFAFCDQDDFWLADKLARAARTLDAGSSMPQMYCSAVQYVDSTLQPIGISATGLRPSFANALVENIATGCTVVFNSAANQLVLAHVPTRALMHDWWLYLVVSAFGKVIFDPEPGIRYRQHGGNVIGGTASFMSSMRTRLRRLQLRRSGVFRCSHQAEEFLRCHGADCPAPARQLAQQMVDARHSFFRRLAFAVRGNVRRNQRIDDALLRVLIVAGLY